MNDDETMVRDLIGRLRASLARFAGDLDALLPRLERWEVEEPAGIFAALGVDVHRALAELDALRAAADGRSATAAATRDDGTPWIADDPVAILMWLDERLGRLLTETAFCRTMVDGRASAELRAALAELAAAALKARRALDAIDGDDVDDRPTRSNGSAGPNGSAPR